MQSFCELSLLNYRNKVFEKLSFNLLEKQLYLVGGAVRNSFLGNEKCDDIDLVCFDNFFFEKFINLKGFKYYKSYNSIVSEDGTLSIVLSRKESFFNYGVKKEYTSSIIVDAYRRDFTLNAIYIDIFNFICFDPLNGIEQLKNKEISLINSNGFYFDNSRLIRGIRLMMELDFKPSPSDVNLYNDFLLTDFKPNARFISEVNKVLSFYGEKKINSFLNSLAFIENYGKLKLGSFFHVKPSKKK